MKKKKPAYWVEVQAWEGLWAIRIYGLNKFNLESELYRSKSRCVQQAKRLAKALDIEFKQ